MNEIEMNIASFYQLKKAHGYVQQVHTHHNENSRHQDLETKKIEGDDEAKLSGRLKF